MCPVPENLGKSSAVAFAPWQLLRQGVLTHVVLRPNTLVAAVYPDWYLAECPHVPRK